MARKKTGKKRGRPADPKAKRHQTTRAGRRGELIEPDRGTKALRRMRREATGSEDLPADLLGVLLGRGRITLPEYHAGRDVAELLDVARRALGLVGRVHSVWAAVLAGGRFGRSPISGTAADWARLMLGRVENWIGDRQVFELVLRVAENDLPPGRLDIGKLRLGLDRVARGWTSRSRAA